jgi:hypothetical protein
MSDIKKIEVIKWKEAIKIYIWFMMPTLINKLSNLLLNIGLLTWGYKLLDEELRIIREQHEWLKVQIDNQNDKGNEIKWDSDKDKEEINELIERTYKIKKYID